MSQPQGPLKVNFTDEEAASKARDIPPSGEYLCTIVDGSQEIVRPGKKNTGKPYWKVRYVIDEGTYSGTSLNATVMLFDGALYSLSQLMGALGYDVNSGEFQVPFLDDLFGKKVIVKGYKRAPSTTPDGQELSERFEVKAYKKSTTSSNNKVGSSSTLP